MNNKDNLDKIFLTALRHFATQYETQRSFANHLEVSPSFLNDLLTGRKKGNESTRRKIAEKLGFAGCHYEKFLDVGREILSAVSGKYSESQEEKWERRVKENMYFAKYIRYALFVFLGKTHRYTELSLSNKTGIRRQWITRLMDFGEFPGKIHDMESIANACGMNTNDFILFGRALEKHKGRTLLGENIYCEEDRELMAKLSEITSQEDNISKEKKDFKDEIIAAQKETIESQKETIIQLKSRLSGNTEVGGETSQTRNAADGVKKQIAGKDKLTN